MKMPMIVSSASPYTRFQKADGSSAYFEGKKHLILFDIAKSSQFAIERELIRRFYFTPIVMLEDGTIAKTSPHSSKESDVHLFKILSGLRFVPHISIDEFVEECFRDGYTHVEVGPGVYGSSFGVQCKFAAEKEPKRCGFPAVWRIAEDFGLSWGCGGHHSHQLIEVVPTGRYGLRVHEAP